MDAAEADEGEADTDQCSDLLHILQSLRGAGGFFIVDIMVFRGGQNFEEVTMGEAKEDQKKQAKRLERVRLVKSWAVFLELMVFSRQNLW